VPPTRGRRPSLLRAFACAGTGLADAAARERNLRIHLALGVVAGCATALLPFSPAERAVVLACMGAVVGAETVNAALEAVVDAVFPGEDERARFAKDAAAGAVLALAAASVLVALALVAPRAGALARRAAALGPLWAVVAAVAFATHRLAGAASAAASIGIQAGVAVVGLALLWNPADSRVPLGAVALLVSTALGAALRRARGHGPPPHAPGGAS
jgi:diacylglycerol kinase (ATP)